MYPLCAREVCFTCSLFANCWTCFFFPQLLFVISRRECNKIYPLKARRDRLYVHFGPQSICFRGRQDFVFTAFTFGQRYLHIPLVAAVIWDIYEAQLIQQDCIWKQCAENTLHHIMQSQRPAQMSVPSNWNFTSFPLICENEELLL